MSIKLSHFGVCVSDLDAALRFYCDGLGFEKGASFNMGNEFKPVLEVEGDVDLTSMFITRDGFTVELSYYKSPGSYGAPKSSRNHLGITHMTYHVTGLQALIEKLKCYGGKVIEQTRMNVANRDGSKLELVFIADPDGNRLELMEQVAGTTA
tara:strand:- start:150 stop:605 length:456 start_codon:yes stop_codon:yes gene_type:complete